MSFLLMMSFMFTSIFFLLNHPLSMGMVLMSQTILIAFITGLLSINFWFSYIMFLIMIGGMLVLFIYMTSIASNELFKFSTKILFLMIVSMMVTLMFIKMNMMEYYYMNTNLMNNESINFSLNKFINYPSNYIMILMIIYLLITLIAVVKIVNLNFGPLRQKF
uniref:NADH-ubiquinone oxidoreductase chain 6 n=1 Tax=Habrocerus capillaricornis TaxID=66340 RepID=A0A0S2MQD6_9COLE|nr:NADH deshydrogenase subunit 6 [Habrocerus capillaricornis]